MHSSAAVRDHGDRCHSALGSLSRTGDASLRDMYAEGLRVILDYVPVDLGELVRVVRVELGYSQRSDDSLLSS